MNILLYSSYPLCKAGEVGRAERGETPIDLDFNEKLAQVWQTNLKVLLVCKNTQCYKKVMGGGISLNEGELRYFNRLGEIDENKDEC